jgi:teichuronic acid biosynthesis glycosyltransferase TuaG
MSITPIVSIITPSYKSKKFILQTLLSIESQSFTDFEVLIIDDASPDGSADYIASILPDERFSLIRLNNNIGAAEARNVGLRAASGRYLAFLDADDLWEPCKLEVQLDFMAKNAAALSFSAYKVISEAGDIILESVAVPKTITRHQYLCNTIIGCLTVVLDKENISKEIIMPNLRSSHDVALWADLLDEIKIGYGCSEVLATYRVVGDSNTSNKFVAAKEVWLMYRNYLNFGFIKSVFYFVQYAFNALKKRKFRIF